jgi:hypothetical protein
MTTCWRIVRGFGFGSSMGFAAARERLLYLPVRNWNLSPNPNPNHQNRGSELSFTVQKQNPGLLSARGCNLSSYRLIIGNGGRQVKVTSSQGGVQFAREASQTRGYCVAKNATHRAARPVRKERLFRMTMKLHHPNSRLLEESACPQTPRQLPYQSQGTLWTRRDSNPHLVAGQANVRPLHHGP